MCRYLLEWTGEARFGDWIEQLAWNGLGAALPPRWDGRAFYYADYRTSGGINLYDDQRFTCCSGSYAQAASELRRLVYFRNAEALLINLFVPSVVHWAGPNGTVSAEITTGYPIDESVRVEVRSSRPSDWMLKFRIPPWCGRCKVLVNGTAVGTSGEPDGWFSIKRTWGERDRVDIKLSLEFREVPVDAGHPSRVAVVRGPVVYVADAGIHERTIDLPDDLSASSAVIADQSPGTWILPSPAGGYLGSRLRPFFQVGEGWRYRMYFDREELPVLLW